MTIDRKRKILIAGGSGFLGQALVDHWLRKGKAEIVILSRREKTSEQPRIRYAKWDGRLIPPQNEAEKPFDIVINLAGAGIADHRWTKAFKEEIITSRVESSQACVKFINNSKVKPLVFLAGSAVGIYGGDREDSVDENSKPANDFLGKVCQKWEKSSLEAEVRTVFLRTGVVLGKTDGPLPVMAKPYRFFFGGPIAGGKQLVKSG